jgi:hypothetical protein
LLGLPITGAGAVTSANLAAVNNALATAGGQNRVDTYAELSSLVSAVATIVTYADDNTQAAPTLAQYNAAGITGVTAANLNAINSAVDANNVSGVDTKAELQAVVNVYNLILAEANGAVPDTTPGVNPTAAQFALIGANIGAAATNAVNLSLLDDAIGGLASTAVDTVAEINDLAAAANAVMAGAAGGVGPTIEQLTLLGISGINATNIVAVQAAIAATADSGLQVDTMAELQAVVNTVVPDATYSLILAEANGSAPDATPGVNPTAAQYAAIGANIGLATSNPAALALLNDVIGNLTTTAIDTIAEINAIAVVIDKVMNSAAGVASALSVADFALLGLPTTGAGAVNAVNLSAVNNAIGSAGGQIKVDTYAELSGLVSAVATIASYANDNTQVAPTLAQYTTAGITGVTAANLGAINSAVDANATTGVDTNVELQAIVDTYNLILAEANGAAADATPAVNPTAAQYTTIGANIGLATSNAQALSLLNDVVGNLTSAAIDTVAEINTLAGLVDKVMNTAAGSASPLSVADYALLGLPTAGPGAVTSVNLNAVNNAIATAGGQNRVDTYAELSSLVSAVATIVTYADDNTQAAPTLAQYNAVGITGVTAANLSAINRAVDANIATGVDTKAELQAVVNNAISLIVIQSPTNNDLISALDLAKYGNTGIEDVDADNLSAVHRTLDALTAKNVETTGLAQNVVDGYNIALIEANSANAYINPSINSNASRFTTIGACVAGASSGILNGTDLATSALALMDSAVADMLTKTEGRVTELNPLGVAVDRTLTMIDSTETEVNAALVSATNETNAILQAIMDTPNAGPAVDTILALQAIVNAHAT